MHPELVAIANVWQADVKVDSLRAEHEGLVAAASSAIEANKAATAVLSEARATLTQLQGKERVNNRELDSYVQKRDATKRMIDEGTAPDYAAAERQLAGCRAKVDELETTGLELLDAIEAAQGAVRAAERAGADAATAERDARQALAARDAAIRSELAVALGARELAWKELPAELRTPYTELRRRKRTVLVNVVEGACSVCHMRVPPQRVVEVQMKRALHTCVGCGGYLLPG